MSGYHGRFVCAEAGCREVVYHQYDTRKDQSEGYTRNKKKPWKCSRHNDPAAHLRPDNTETQHVLEVYEKAYGKFWAPSNNGLARGPGFFAFAEDFPVGTRLTVTTSVATSSAPDPAETEEGTA